MDPQALAAVFVKTVVRMFYETEHIVVIDALIFHKACAWGPLLRLWSRADEK
jgi:transcription initiation factor TFIIE subunit alpha